MELSIVSRYQIAIADRMFKTKEEARRYFRKMLRGYSPGEKVMQGGDDERLLRALLTRHPEAAHKIGAGIYHFEVRKVMGNQCFWIVRNDGTETDFSIHSCLDGSPSAKRMVSAALRFAVSEDVRLQKAEIFGGASVVPCAVTGKMLTVDQGHMDHQPPMIWDVILAQFLIDERLTYDAIGVGTGADAQVVPIILDEALVDRFRVYHRRVARLAFVEASVNMSMGARPRFEPEKTT